jgi:hypothetical protein
MNSPENVDWPKANQNYLMAAVALVRSNLERHTRRAKGEPENSEWSQAAEHALHEAANALPAPSASETLCAIFCLSPFERSVLLLCAGVELDSKFSGLCAALHGDSRRSYPTFSLALAALPEAHWSALSPTAPLRRWRLIELTSNDGLVYAPLRIDERVLHFLTGINTLDERLHGLVEPVSAPAELPPSHTAVAGRIVDLLKALKADEELPVVQLCGGDCSSRRAVAVTACSGLGLRLHGVRQSDMPTAPIERESLSRLWEREAMLSNSALLIETDEMDIADYARTLLPFLEDIRGILFIGCREPLRLWYRPIVRFEIEKPTSAEQNVLWQQALGEDFPQLNGQIENVVSQFNADPSSIKAASAEIRLWTNDKRELGTKLWDACRVQSRTRLDNLAQRIQPAATWEDLVLPEAQCQTLREIAIHVRQRTKVYETWGFATKGERGLGISALFAGSSGTGKTMAAEVLASELRLDLYRIDLSSVVSKYIGETEKNLRRVFDAAEEGGAILLFDEADALFGKRSEVKDSHDRYANIEISYLLQRMEQYRGLAVLTTNMKEGLDSAFLRRIRFIVHFPFPDLAARAEMWRRIFPAQTPTDGLASNKLARLNVAGGNIRNIALNAAFLAADTNDPVRMNHLLRAARTEYAKIEKPLTDAEIKGWQ